MFSARLLGAQLALHPRQFLVALIQCLLLLITPLFLLTEPLPVVTDGCGQLINQGLQLR